MRRERGERDRKRSGRREGVGEEKKWEKRVGGRRERDGEPEIGQVSVYQHGRRGVCTSPIESKGAW